MLGTNKPCRVPTALLLFVFLSIIPEFNAADLNWPLSPLSDCPARNLNQIIETSWQQSTATSCEQLKTTDYDHITVDSLPANVFIDSTITTIPQSQTSPHAGLLSTPTLGDDDASEIGKDGSKSAPPSLLTVENSRESEAPLEVDRDSEGDSPLDNANFLSFEEWKKQNLAKAGQTVENLSGRASTGDGEPRRRPGNINNPLDSLGEDAELEIDFGGFGRPGKTAYNIPPRNAAAEDKNSAAEGVAGTKSGGAASVSYTRGKDAGKTCKERFNYASFDCAATVLKTNKESKGSTSILVENKDNYMLNQCLADNKFLIVELCEDILVDTIVLANFEFFSSMFRTFRVSVSDRYPVKLDKWRALGTFEARNSREVQAFLVESPLIWARYIRFEFLTHYGNEYYCPVSLLRVHGTTMMEEFNHEMKGMREEEDTEIENGEEEDEASLGSVSHVIIADALKEVSMTASKQAGENGTAPFPYTTLALPPQPSIRPLQEELATQATSNSEIYPTGLTFFESLLGSRMEAAMLALDDHNLVCQPSDQKPNALPTLSSQVDTIYPSMASGGIDSTSEPMQNDTSYGTKTSSLVSTGSVESPSTLSTSASDPTHTESKPPLQNSSKAVSQTSQVSARAPTSSTQHQAANPTTQESFFKSVHKRLQLLESNSTLSLQYIEEQSRILRDAFSKVEKRQLAKTTAFLESLNTTVLNEIYAFRSQYDRIWQTTVLELSSQKEQSRNDVIALSARLSVLADEVVFQKRMTILQLVLTLLCFGLVLFSRGFSSSSAALLQNIVDLSSANPARYTRFETPRSSPSSTRPPSRYGILGRSSSFTTSTSEELVSAAAVGTGTSGGRDGATAWNAVNSPRIEYSPPTPMSSQAGDDEKRKCGDEMGEDDSLGSSVEDDGRLLRFPQRDTMLGESRLNREQMGSNESHED